MTKCPSRRSCECLLRWGGEWSSALSSGGRHAPDRPAGRGSQSLDSRNRLLQTAQRGFLSNPCGGRTDNQHSSPQPSPPPMGTDRKRNPCGKAQVLFSKPHFPSPPLPYSQKPEALQGNTCQFRDVNKACSESVFFFFFFFQRTGHALEGCEIK